MAAAPQLSEVRQFVSWLDAHAVRPIVVVSHPRSGTHLMIDALRLNFRECRAWKRPGEPFERLYLNLDSLTCAEAPLSWPTARRILSRCQRPMLKTHALPGFEKFLLAPNQPPLPAELTAWLYRRADFLYVYRHVSRVMCSLHRFVGGYDTTARVPISQFLRQTEGSVSRVKAWAQHVVEWLDHPRVQAVRMEDLLSAPAATMASLGEWLGLQTVGTAARLPTPPKNRWQHRLSKLLRMRPTSTAVLGGCGSGRPQDPEEAFSSDDLKFIRGEVDDLLFRLNYEDDEFWANAAPALHTCPATTGN